MHHHDIYENAMTSKLEIQTLRKLSRKLQRMIKTQNIKKEK